ncbi:BspA family leucine-rich repeat surface protein [Lactiplantibacillus daowaiensis]|uniref:BspA family leucine-rich repeat surface protein n=1 Tax=Lactiplantibacillus daowaiensis TaxID=2559918 RepID=A0ABW1S182_9LACO|nr:BspA family leucine-rich repeat surface protein [Lactiplantibacillus daowaiensis]
MKQFNQGNQPHYKHGNLWIYVGLATISATWQLGQLTAQAAATTTETTIPTTHKAATDPATTTTESHTVVLSSHTDQETPAATAPQTPTTTTAQPTGQTATNAAQPTASTTPSQQSAQTEAKQPQVSTTTQPVQADKPVTSVKPDDASDTPANQPAATDQVDQQTETTPTQVTAVQPTPSQTTPTTPAPTKVQAWPARMSKAMVAPDLATSVANDPTGIDWKITADGTLHLAAGTLADLSDNVDVSPWQKYQNQIKTIDFDGPVVASAGINGLFSGLSNVKTINNLTNLDTTNATDMGSMFKYMTALTSLDLSKFKTSNVHWMNNMFDGDAGLTSLDVTGFDTGNVYDMARMFAGLDGLTSLDLSQLNTKSVGYDPGDTGTFTLNELVAGGFNSQLATLKLPTFDLTNVPEMQYVFENLNQLTSLTLSSVNHGSRAIDYSGMLSMMAKLKTLDLANFQLNNADNTDNLLSQLPALTTLTLGPQNTLGAFTQLEGSAGSYLDQWVSQNDGTTYSTFDLTNLYGSNRDTAVLDTYTHKSFFTGKATTQLAGPKATWNPLHNITVLDAFMGTEDQTDQQLYTFDGQTLYNADGTEHTGELNTGSLTSMQHPITVTITDAQGQSVTPAELAAQPGVYAIHYATEDNFGNPMTTDGAVTVIATKATVKAKSTDQPVLIGPATSQLTWQASDNFASATDAQGQALALDQLTAVTITRDQTPVDTVDYTKAGTYAITYQYTDPAGNERTDTVTVVVKASAAAVSVKQATVTFFAGNQHTTWSALANLDQVTDATGQPTTLTRVTVTKDGQPTATNQVEPAKAGVYTVTYTYADVVGNQKTATTTVTVKPSLADLQTQPVTKYAGGQAQWQAADNLQFGTDENGQPLTATSPGMVVTVAAENGEPVVNTKVPGVYTITYTYTDVDGNTITANAPLTVKASAARLTPTTVNQTYYADAQQPLPWDAAAGLAQSLSATGQPLPITALQLRLDSQLVTGPTLPLTVGQHQVTYTYTDPDGNVTTTVVPVTVKADQADFVLTTTNPTITAGQSWSALSNVASLVTTDGHQVSPTAVTVTYRQAGQLVPASALSQPGIYTVQYQYTDTTGKQLTQQATLTVVAPTPVTPIQPTTPGQPTNPTTPVATTVPTKPEAPSPVEPTTGQKVKQAMPKKQSDPTTVNIVPVSQRTIAVPVQVSTTVKPTSKVPTRTPLKASAAKAKQDTLPQTDEVTNQSQRHGFGLLLLAIFSPLLFWRKRRS